MDNCSKWAEKYRVMGKPFPGPWSFKRHPWLRDMHDSEAPLNCGMKAAQCGYTESVLNRSFYKMDIEKVDVLYVLPAKNPDASDFSVGRFDAALELSEHLQKLFSDIKNVGHKRAGPVNMYLRGAKSKSGLKSLPVAFLVLDEVNEFPPEAIPLARERLSGQLNPQIWAISTPTITKFGISEMFEDTTQEHFHFRCPSCSRFTELIFPDCLKICGDSHYDPEVKQSTLLCKECKNVLNHETKSLWLESGKWIPSFANREGRGFYINQMYSSATAGSPVELARAFLKTVNNPANLQEFYNSKLGLPFTVPGAQLTDSMLLECRGGHKMGPSSSSRWVTMGVDVGTWLHCEIIEWELPSTVKIDINVGAKGRVISAEKVLHFEELDTLMHKYRVNFCVIDANPERRKAMEFANRFWGYVKLCFYGRGVQGKQIQIPKDNDGEPTITVDRTSWLDLSLGRFKNKTIVLPIDVPLEYREHLCALVRSYEKDADDNPIGRYVKGHEDDHYAHSRNYSEIALTLMLGIGETQNIE